MHQLGWLVLAAATATLAACDVGPSLERADDTSELHAAVIANASVVMQDALVDLSEALPPMTTNAEPET